MTEAECRKAVAVLLGAYPSVRIERVTAFAYERMLADLPYPVVNAAIERLLATSKFMPTVAEIRATCLALSHGEQRAAGEAWGDVLKALRRYGVYRTPGRDFEFEDPVVAECVRALRWDEICNSEFIQADRARFIALYDQLAAKNRTLQLSEGLPAMQRLRATQERDRQAVSAGDAVANVIALLPGKDEG